MSTITLAPQSVRRPVAGPTARPSSSVRLTRRGRLVVFVLALLVVATVALSLAAGSAASGESGGDPAIELVTVAPGETLWDIAGDVAGGGDVRDVVAEIQQLNALDSSVVYAGQELRVPASR
ncbi:LysM peptidoglycan-binding domain-containing protein [Nocardioides caeni]|uniref:LysM peptidoglycan-binding domain-containing protein n=1 Tax=Nocardioides caeni TaxID=574700 RepID=A0A4S8NI07_9ACTN|nr:LysM peptidoglycan-binding domain-containing protein [Nocardioides caeni]THV14644.1 LysM peptidoglycan-binding domain-containing protein [Nocardioides caeni]